MIAGLLRPFVLLAFFLFGSVSIALAIEVPAFQRGINLARLHNLTPEDPARPGTYIWPPFSSDLAQISDAELQRLRDVGYDFVRLPVAPAPFLSVSEPERRLLIDGVYDTVRRLQGFGFGVLVDAHPDHADPNWSAPAILARADGPALAVYEDWLKQLARYLRQLPAGKTALGLMNEPQVECVLQSDNEWTKIQPRLFRAVRDIAPDLALVLTTGCWSDAEALRYLDMAEYDDNTLIDLHFYGPYMYTHQGLPFAGVPVRYLSGLAYPGVDADRSVALDLAEQIIAERRSGGELVPDDAMVQVEAAIANYYDDPPIVNLDYIEETFDIMAQWGEAQGVEPARLILGEFGVTRQPEGMPDIPGRDLWLHDVRSAAEAKGFGWALWDYNAGNGYPGFGLVFDNESRKIDANAVRALGLDASVLPE